MSRRVQKDHYARVSYLFQAANLCAETGNTTLARALNRKLDLVLKRTVLRLLPHLKRKLCRKCFSPLIPGLTMTIALERHSEKAPELLVHTCGFCQHKKRFPVEKNYTLFCDANATS